MKKILLFLLALVTVAACSRIRPIEEPVIPIPVGVESTTAIKLLGPIMIERGWAVTDVTKDSLVAKLDQREHSVTIKAAVIDSSIKLQYVASEGLRFTEKDGTRYIHRRYQTWIKNLEMDLQKALSKALVESKLKL